MRVVLSEIPALAARFWKLVMNFWKLLLEIDIVMSSSLFMLITYYSVMTDTNECD